MKNVCDIVRDLLNNEETIEREFGAFNSISDHYPKYVISYDTIQIRQRQSRRNRNMICLWRSGQSEEKENDHE